MSNTVQKGELLEKIIESLCSSNTNSSVQRNVKVIGKSGIERQIDVQMDVKNGSFVTKIIIEAKNYNSKVGVDVVESFNTKLFDIGGHLGILACPLGFTKGAIASAALHNIQLYQVFDHALNNTNQLIPMRYIEPYIDSYQIQISHEATNSGLELPGNQSKWRFFIKKKNYSIKESVIYAWNNGLIPQSAGVHTADFGVVKFSTTDDLNQIQYLEYKLKIIVCADYYFKLFPASYMKNISSSHGNHKLHLDMHSNKDGMLKHGWRHFNNSDDMNREANIYDTSKDMRGLITSAEYTLDDTDS